jgi:hypothetical protein
MAKHYVEHHCIPRSKASDDLDPNVRQNIAVLPRNKHEALHSLYKNATPKEQLEQWLDMNIKVVSDEVRISIMKALILPDRMFYSKVVLKPKNE